jgi:crotonobetainyl-CoA:carnitine CoA-transferase CaiB-like acyl-CoA transferase
MFEAFTSFMLLEHLAGETFDPPNAPTCYGRQVDPDRQPFPTSDGYISIVAYTDEAWPRIFEMLGNPSFLSDERFATFKLRSINIAPLYQEIARLTQNFTTAELLVLCHEAQIPAQAARDISEIKNDPHLEASGFFKRRTHPTEGDYFEIQPPIRFDDYERPVLDHAPKLGEHSEEVRFVANEHHTMHRAP